ncbi:MAG TPA: TIGR00730 family Rossman fold protein [Candidatus Dormibacteraeota bacterium]|nr:TIGR00730 family Rossman fold protein [Candidatus Dormibacteraeota bacterium]
MQRICVFCGSNSGARPAYAETARAFGRALAARDLDLVYGGGSLGLMGILADATLAAGGRAIGVLPRGLFRREVPHAGLTVLHEVGSMHERKALMADLADAFVALPGGYGTFDELFEIITWAQIGLHAKPIALLDVEGYFDPLVSLVERAVEEHFVPHPLAALVRRTTDLDALLDELTARPAVAQVSAGEELPQR